MNYFASGLYGNYELYKEIKGLIKAPDDHVWILGDVLDGNTNRPQDGLKILTDILRSDNVSLVLGDHEYFHIMRIFNMGDPDSYAVWEDTLMGMDVSAAPLLDYMRHADEDRLFSLVHEASQQCNASEMVKIGDRIFYLCHGAPALRGNTQGSDVAWQYGVVTSTLEMSEKYIAEIASDIRIQQFADLYGGIDIKKTFVISGGTSVDYGLNCGGKDMDGMAYCRRKFCIGQNATADSPQDKFGVLAVDSAGFWTVYL